MSDAPHLFDLPPAAVTLTDRQAHTLQLVRRTEGGLQADEVGADLHALTGKHQAGTRCDWCTATGKEVLGALRRKGLLVRRRTGFWQVLDGQTVEATESAQTDEIPFG